MAIQGVRPVLGVPAQLNCEVLSSTQRTPIETLKWQNVCSSAKWFLVRGMILAVEIVGGMGHNVLNKVRSVEISALIESLRKQSVDREIISTAMAEVHGSA